MTITGKDLIEFGFEGAELGQALKTVRNLGLEGDAFRDWAGRNRPAPKLGLQAAPDYEPPLA